MARSRSPGEAFAEFDSRFAFEHPTWTREILRVMAVAGLLPDLADDAEPVRHPFDPSDLDREAERLGTGWLGKVRREKVRSHVIEAGAVILSRARGIDESWLALVGALARLVEPRFGFVHVLLDAEVREAYEHGRFDLRFANNNELRMPSFGTAPRIVAARGLPTLYWRTYLGPALQGLFGDRLHAAPWARLERLPGTDVLVADVTHQPPTEEAHDLFAEARDDIIDALGRDAFFPGATRLASALALAPEHGEPRPKARGC